MATGNCLVTNIPYNSLMLCSTEQKKGLEQLESE